MTAKTAFRLVFTLCLFALCIAANAQTTLNVTSNGAQAAPTTTTIAQSGSPGNYTLTATVTSFGGTTAPTGTVSFLDTSNADAMVATAVLGNGTGTAGVVWNNSQTPATKPGPQSVVVGDFNGDGKADIAVGAPGFVSILLGKGDGTFTVNAANNFATLANNQNMAVAKFINGSPDVILTVSNSPNGNNNTLEISSDGKGGEIVSAPFTDGLVSVSAVATADFNGDGKQDYLLAGMPYSSAVVPVFGVTLGKGDGTFGTVTLFPVGNAILAIGVGDFLGNGKTDIAVVTAVPQTPGSSSVLLFENDGAGNFTPGPSTTVTGVNPASMVVADFNGDGKADLAVMNTGNNTVSVLQNNGNGTFKPLASPATGASPSSIAVGDFNGDKIADLAVANRGSNTVTILLGKGDGTFAASSSPTTGNAPISLAVGAFNGGTSDLAVANSSDGTVTVLLSQTGLTATATATNIAVAGSGAHLVDASYPGDGTYAASVSGTTSLSANTISTALALTANPTSIALGQQVLLSATLTPYSSGSTTTNGEMVTFSNGSTSLGTGTLSSGVATLNTTSLTAGTDSVTATYAGDTNFNTSTSSAVHVAVSAPVPTVTLNQSSLTFDSQLAGSTSAAQSITLTNTGQGALSINSIAASGDFAETNTCGSSVAAAGMCSISVKFTPTAAGARSGTLTITDNASGSPQTVALSGTGESVGLTSSTTALTISSDGESATATIQLSPMSGFSGTVNLACSVTYQGTGPSKLPPTCTMNPTQAQITGNSAVSSTLTVSTSKNAATTGGARAINTAQGYGQTLRTSGAALAALFLFGMLPRRRWRKGLVFGFLCMMVIGGIVGCGSSSNQGTTAGSYQVTVTATSGSATVSTMIPLTVQ